MFENNEVQEKADLCYHPGPAQTIVPAHDLKSEAIYGRNHLAEEDLLHTKETPLAKIPRVQDILLDKEELEEEESQECMVCLDREADTMVWPCEHRVVCKECSKGLERSNDAHTCLRCRRPITHVFN